MKVILAAVIALGAVSPALAGEYQRGYSSSKVCTRNVYREEYVPGTQENPGYVKNWTETVDVPCNSSGSLSRQPHSHAQPEPIDNNDCSQGSLLGGLLGAGVGGMASRGEGRWLAVPAGGVAGAMIGCQLDGG